MITNQSLVMLRNQSSVAVRVGLKGNKVALTISLSATGLDINAIFEPEEAREVGQLMLDRSKEAVL